MKITIQGSPWLSILIFGFVGFSVVSIAQTTAPKPSAMTEGSRSGLLPPPSTSETNRTLRLKLQVRLLDHLLVKEGDKITKGQVIADQIDDRTRLDAQKLELAEALKRTQDSVILDPIAPRSVPELAALPNPTYAAEEAAIDKAKRVLERTTDKAKLQQRMLDMLRYSNALPEMIEHETVKLGEAIGESETALAEYDLAKGNLLKAQADYQQLQYQHSVNFAQRIEEQSRSAQLYQQRLSEVANQRRIKESQVSQLKLQIQAIDDKLSLLAQIKSPYEATIRRIRIVDQVGNFLNVELVLSPTSSFPDRSRSEPNTSSILRGTGAKPSPQSPQPTEGRTPITDPDADQ